MEQIVIKAVVSFNFILYGTLIFLFSKYSGIGTPPPDGKPRKNFLDIHSPHWQHKRIAGFIVGPGFVILGLVFGISAVVDLFKG